MSKIEEAAKPMGFNVHKRNYKVLMQFFGYCMPHKRRINWLLVYDNHCFRFADEVTR